jgi:hypothetical protein
MKYKQFHNFWGARYYIMNGQLLTELHMPYHLLRLFKLQRPKRSFFQLTAASRGIPPLRLIFPFTLSQTKQFYSHPNKNTHVLQ